MVLLFVHRLYCLIKKQHSKSSESNTEIEKTVIKKACYLLIKINNQLKQGGLNTDSFPTLSQASDIIFWNRTADLMPSNINATLSWLLLAAGVEADLFQNQIY